MTDQTITCPNCKTELKYNEVYKIKIKFAHRFFNEISRKYSIENLNYDAVNSFGKLMELVK